ncbi:MAG: hypothetical protein LBU77_03475, partial [Clostridiales bacterium]|nr:hypothetical protein [Clostridiales bacterium]
LASKQQTIDDIEELILKFDDLTAKQKEVAESQAEMYAKTSEYAPIMETLTADTIKLEETYNDLVEAAFVYGFAIDKNLSQEENMIAAKEMLTAEFEKQSGAIDKYNNELVKIANTLDTTAEAMKKMIDPTKELNSAYQSLAKGESLSADTLLDLIELYPEIARHIAENVNWCETLIGVIAEEAQKSKEASLAELTARRNELIVAKAKLVGVEKLADGEKKIYQEMFENAGDNLKKFTDFVGEAVKTIMEKGVLNAAFEAVTSAASDAANAEVKAINDELKIINAQINALDLTLDKDFTTGAAKSSKEKVKTAEEIAKELFDIDKKAFEDEKALSEMSLAAQAEKLETLKEKHKAYKDGVIEIDRELYSIRREMADEWYAAEMDAVDKLNKGRDDNTDFSGILNRLGETLASAREIYAAYPETLKKIEKEITELMTDTEEDRGEKLARIASDAVDEQLRIYQRLGEIQKNRDGITGSDADIMAANRARYDYLLQNEASLTDAMRDELEKRRALIESTEIEIKENLIEIETERIQALEANRDRLTNEESAELEERKQQVRQYQEDIEDLEAAHVKKIIEINKKTTEDLAKELDNRIKMQTDAAKKISKEYTESIKERYAEQIKLAEAAADAEVKLYSDKIKEIDDILKAEERAESEADFNDRLKRLQEQLKYEKDDANIYELEKQIALEQTEYDKQKRRESLEDEKASLQEQMTAVKENLSEQKQALQDLRDAEIKAAEDSLAAYIADLEKRKSKNEELTAEETEAIKKELDIRKGNEKKYLNDTLKQQEQSEKDRRNLMSRTTDYIIADLYSRISDFIAAGAEAGQAWSDAFASKMDAASTTIAESVSYAGTGAASPAARAASTTNTFSIANTFMMPVAQPSKVAAAQTAELEAFARYMR